VRHAGERPEKGDGKQGQHPYETVARTTAWLRRPNQPANTSIITLPASTASGRQLWVEVIRWT